MANLSQWRRRAIVGAGPALGAAVGIITNIVTDNWNWWLVGSLVVLVSAASYLVVAIDSVPTPPPARVDGPAAGDTESSVDDPAPEPVFDPASGLALLHQPPVPPGPLVPRSPLSDEIVRWLVSTSSEPAGVSALQGAGGFGKTTLCALVCRHPDVVAAYPGGILWLTAGNVTDAELASKVSDLCQAMTRVAVPATDLVVVAATLAAILDTRPRCLLVIDDVWQPGHVQALIVGAARCTRLITTRSTHVIPRNAHVVTIGAMAEKESAAMIGAGLDGPDASAVRALVRATGGWPVLMAIVNSAIAEKIRQGATADEAVRWAVDRILQRGPTALDVSDSTERTAAVSSTLEASLQLLSGEELDRYTELCIFPEDALVPLPVVEMLWDRTDWGDAGRTEDLCNRLARLNLALMRWHNGEPCIQLHDVVREYLRHRVLPEAIVALNSRLLDSVRSRRGLAEGTAAPARWWDLSPGDTYLWRQIGYHFVEAGREGEFAAVAGDLRWLVAKAEHRSLGPAALDEDLSRLADPTMQHLRRILAGSAHLFGPPAAPNATANVLISRTGGDPGLEVVVDRFRALRRPPYLDTRWPLADRPDPAMLRVLGTNDLTVRDGVFIPGSGEVAVGGDDTFVRIWEVGNGRLTVSLAGHSGAVWACAASPRGDLVATAGDDCTVKVWDVAGEEPVTTLSGHTAQVNAVVFHPDGRRLLSAGEDRTLRVWDIATGVCEHVLTEHAESIRCCAISPDGSLAVSGGNDKALHVWDLAAMRLSSRLAAHDDWIWGCAISPDGAFAASASDDETIRVWDLRDGTVAHVLRGHLGSVNCVAFVDSSSRLLSGGDDRTLRLWDVPGERAVRVVRGHGDRVRSCRLSPDSNQVISTSNDGTARIWDLPAIARPVGDAHDVKAATTCAMSADGAVVVSGGDDGMVYVWDAVAGDVLHAVPAHAGAVWDCALALDGSVVVTAGEDGRVRLWELADGSLIRTLTVDGCPQNSCAISADGAVVVSGGDDGTVYVWDAVSGDVLHAVPAHQGAVTGCTFSPAGDLFASTGVDRALRVWSCDGVTAVTAIRVADALNDCAWLPGPPRSADAGGAIAAVGEGGVFLFDLVV